MRCEGGDTYLQYIKEIMSATRKGFEKIDNYEFLLFDDVNRMIERVRKKDKEYGLSKTVAGFAWDWKTKQKRPFQRMVSIFYIQKEKTDFPNKKNCGTIQQKKAERLLFANLWLIIRRLL